MKKITIQTEATIKAEGKFNSKHCKPIMCIKNDGSELRSFSSVWDAAEQLGIHPGYMSTCMSKGVPCKGYTCFSTKDAASFIGAIVESYNKNAQDASVYRGIKAEEEAARLAKEMRQNAIAKLEAKIAKLNDDCKKYETKFCEAMTILAEANQELAALRNEADN